MATHIRIEVNAKLFRLTLLVCLLHTARTRVHDDVIEMCCKRIAMITKPARERLEQVRAENREKSKWLLGVFGEVITGTR